MWHSVAVVLWLRGESTDSSGACTPPHRQPLCGVVGPLGLPVRNRISSLIPLAISMFCVCTILFLCRQRFLWLRTVRPPGAGNRPLRDVSRGHNTPIINMLTNTSTYYSVTRPGSRPIGTPLPCKPLPNHCQPGRIVAETSGATTCPCFASGGSGASGIGYNQRTKFGKIPPRSENAQGRPGGSTAGYQK